MQIEIFENPSKSARIELGNPSALTFLGGLRIKKNEPATILATIGVSFPPGTFIAFHPTKSLSVAAGASIIYWGYPPGGEIHVGIGLGF